MYKKVMTQVEMRKVFRKSLAKKYFKLLSKLQNLQKISQPILKIPLIIKVNSMLTVIKNLILIRKQ